MTGTILVVDDSKFERELLASAINAKCGFQTLEAAGGPECLDIIERHPVHLILMDIVMPGNSGMEVLTKIRKKFNPIQLPVIMVTSKADDSDVIQALQSGANDYIVKPINFQIAISRISTHLRLAQLSAEMSMLKEIAAIDSMIATYNHEINNPLQIAFSALELTERMSDESAKSIIRKALIRIVDIVRKIRDLSEKKENEYKQYAEFDRSIGLK